MGYLQSDRIGHGVATASDHKLVTEIANRGIGLETCPSSNVQTMAVRDFKNHPIRDFYDAGILVSVNTDDPPMFGTDICNECLQLH
ncbi:hypothetical protein GF326_05655 [Candidatus Bathyarchaeota archaeon]|nr:hypothetical protein [Candidatus Bathyarchaeota archaeon]